MKSETAPLQKQKHLSLPVVLSGGAVFLATLALSVSIFHGVALHNVPQALSQSAEGFRLADRTDAAATPKERHLFSGSSQIIADVAESIAPSVVNIDVKQKSRGITMSPLDDELFQRFFGMQPSPFRQYHRNPVIRGNGSGVIINAMGHVLTNNHVVNGAQDIQVTLNDGRKFPARVLGQDAFSDLAVLELAGASHLKPAKLGTSSRLRPGEWVIAVGSPLGFDHTVTLGIVSALSRQVPDINANVEFIQTDAAINPGNSGGPLVNLDGEVIGINTAIAGSGQNIGFAIPVDVARKVVTDLIQTGHITRPWIGISMAELKPELAKSMGIPPTIQGVIVAQVMPNSPSEKAGFQQGDIIQRINGAVVKNPKDIQTLVRDKPLNTELNVQILRNGQMNALSLKTEALPDAVMQAPDQTE